MYSSSMHSAYLKEYISISTKFPITISAELLRDKDLIITALFPHTLHQSCFHRVMDLYGQAGSNNSLESKRTQIRKHVKAQPAGSDASAYVFITDVNKSPGLLM